MRIIITALSFSLLFSLSTVQAQNDKSKNLGIVEDTVHQTLKKDKVDIQNNSAEIIGDIDDDEVFYIVEKMPLFNGGDPAIEFRKFIAMNLRYPDKAAENGEDGTVIVQFAIDKNGRLVDSEIVAGISPSLDAETLRVVNISPPWTPGQQKGENVKVLFTFPINYVLQGVRKKRKKLFR